MKPSTNATDATLLQNILLGTRQSTQKLLGTFEANVVTCSPTTVTFRLDGYSTRAGFQAPLPSGWPVQPTGTSILVAAVSTASGGTEFWVLSSRNNAAIPQTVFATGSAGVGVSNATVTVLTFDPYSSLGITTGLFRLSWGVFTGANGSGGGTLVVAGYSYDGGRQMGNYLAGVEGSTFVSAFDGQTVEYDVWGYPVAMKWHATASGSPIELIVTYSGNCDVAATLELLKAG